MNAPTFNTLSLLAHITQSIESFNYYLKQGLDYGTHNQDIGLDGMIIKLETANHQLSNAGIYLEALITKLKAEHDESAKAI